jgi:hypothetical protein
VKHSSLALNPPEAQAVGVIVGGGIFTGSGDAGGVDGGRIEAELFLDGVDNAALADGAEFGGFHFLGGGVRLDVDAVALFFGQRDEGGDGILLEPNDP